MIRPAIIVMALAASGCGPWLTTYQRGSPRRLDVVKKPSAPALRWFAVRRAGGEVELIAKRERSVSVSRSLHYNAWRADFTTTGNPLMELVEMVVGGIVPLMFPASLFTRQSFLGSRDSATRKIRVRNNQALAVLSPAQGGWLTMAIDVRPTDEDVFVDPPQVRNYTVRLPAANLALRFEVLDDGARPVAAGETMTDSYGRARLSQVPDGAIAIQIVAEGATAIIAIDEP